MKRPTHILMICCLALTLSLPSCSSKESAQNKESNTEASTKTADPQPDETFNPDAEIPGEAGDGEADNGTGNPDEGSDGPAIAEMATFDNFFQNFLQQWNKWTPASFAKFIHPEMGFFVVNNPGAFTFPTYCADANAFFDQFSYIEYRKNVSCNLQEGDIPEYSCETEGWDKEGCFQGAPGHTGLAEHMELMKEYDLGKGAAEPHYPIAQKIDKMTTVEVYNTDHTVGWFFGVIDGEWYLLNVDMVDPCSA